MIHGLNISALKRTVRLGIKSLWLHRLRSLLTALGIVFGVCSVIAMLAIGEGASYEAQEQIKNLGSQNIILRSAKPPEEQKISDKGSQSYVLQYGLTYKDVETIRATIPGVTVVLPARVIRDYVWNISRRVGASGQPHSVISVRKFATARIRRACSGTDTIPPDLVFAAVVRLAIHGSMCAHRSKVAGIASGSVSAR